MAEDNARTKPKLSEEALAILQKAKEAAKAEGKDWKAVSKDERLVFRQNARAIVKRDAKREARKAEKSAKSDTN